MADENIKTFKLGDNSTYKVDDIVRIHQAQEDNFYRYLRDIHHFDDAMINQMKGLITGKMNSIKSGNGVFGADWSSDSDEVINKYTTYKEKGKKRTQGYDLTKAMNYYFSQLSKDLSTYTPEEPKANDFDNTKHGFGSYLTNEGYTYESVFGLDPKSSTNTTDPKSTTERFALAKNMLTQFKDDVNGRNYTFTNDDNPYNDDYIEDLERFLTDWGIEGKLNNSQIEAGIRKFAGDEWAKAFSHTGWELDKTLEESRAAATAAASQRQTEDQEKKRKDALNRWHKHGYDTYNQQYKNRSAEYYTPIAYAESYTDFMDWYTDLSPTQQQEYGAYLANDPTKWRNAWSNYMNSLINNVRKNDEVNTGILLQGTFANARGKFTDLGNGWHLINESINPQNGIGYQYNPTDGSVKPFFLGDPSNQQNTEIWNHYINLGYDWIKANNLGDYSSYQPIFASGGNLIPKHQLGQHVDYHFKSVEQKNKEKAEKNGISAKAQRERDRYINSDNASVASPDAGFTMAEWTRLATIGADLISMGFDPVTGAAIGLGSSITNFVTDIADDGWQWSDLGNFAASVGLDVVGMIPIYGDMIGTGGKVTKTLVRLAPKFLSYFAGYQGVKNFKPMWDSWSKMLSQDKDAKMTVQDWRNIAMSINLVTGGVRAIRNTRTQNRLQEQAKVHNAVAVNVRNNKTGEIEQIIVNGETARNIKGMTSAGNKASIETELEKLHDFQGKFTNGDLEVMTGPKGLQWPWQPKTENGVTTTKWDGFRGQGRAEVSAVYDFNKVKNYGKKYLKKAAKYNVDKKTADHRGALTTEEYVQYEPLRQQVDEKVEALRQRMDQFMDDHSRLESEIGQIDVHINNANKNLKKVDPDKVDAELKDTKSKLEAIQNARSRVEAVENDLRQLQERYNTVVRDLSTAPSKSRRAGRLAQQKSDLATKIKTQEQELKDLLSANNKSSKHESKYTELITKLEGIQKALADRTSLRQQRDDLVRQRNALSQYNTQEYIELRDLLDNFKSTNPKIGNKNIDWDLDSILRQSDLYHAFKQGGPININKLNTFLNYAKG